jgi:hypothetical protein
MLTVAFLNATMPPLFIVKIALFSLKLVFDGLKQALIEFPFKCAK